MGSFTSASLYPGAGKNNLRLGSPERHCMIHGFSPKNARRSQELKDTMNGIREKATASTIGLFLALSGCSGLEPTASFEATQAGAIMTRLRDRHGGVERFRQFTGVIFSYRVQFRNRVRRFDRVGFRFADPDHLWIRPSVETETFLLSLRGRSDPLVAHAVTAIAPAATTPDGFVGLTGTRARDRPVTGEIFPEPEPELDLALRSIHFLFEPSLTTSIGPWRYRTLVAPGHAGDMRRIEVEPWPTYSVDGNYLFEDDSRTGLLSQILYRGTHPVVRGRTQLVAFDDYASVQRIKVARRRVHRRPLDVEEAKTMRNPFVVSSTNPEETFLSEHLDRIRFLTATEADEFLPLPNDEDGS